MERVFDLLNASFVHAARRCWLLETGTLQRTGGQWTVRAPVTPALFVLITPTQPVRFSTHLMHAQGVPHLVLCQHVAGWQHRIVVQLLGPTLKKLLQDCKSEEVRVELESVLPVPVHASHVPRDAWSADLLRCCVPDIPGQLSIPLRAMTEAASRCLQTDAEGLLPPSDSLCATWIQAPEYVRAASAFLAAKSQH